MVELAVVLVVAALIALLARKHWWPFTRVSYVVSRHVGKPAATLATVSRTFATIDLPNIEGALRQLAPNGRRHGVAAGLISFHSEPLAKLLTGSSGVAGLKTDSIEVGFGQTMVCMVNGIVLIDRPVKAVVYVHREDMLNKLEVEVASEDPAASEAILKQIVDSCGGSSVYKGQIISVSCDRLANRGGQCLSLLFNPPTTVQASDLILPPEILDLIRRNTVGFFESVDRLRSLGMSVKRGLLLYGRPGTGKTMTAKWIAGSVPGLTTFFLSADQLFLIKDCCQMARMLAPAMIVLEDVDLVARDRGEEENIHSRITLNQLLNEMDGIADNTGVLFLMTTNRADELEQALAGRPGRVDQAIEYPLPDETRRKDLLDRYLRGIPAGQLDLDDIVARTEGVPPAFGPRASPQSRLPFRPRR